MLADIDRVIVRHEVIPHRRYSPGVIGALPACPGMHENAVYAGRGRMSDTIASMPMDLMKIGTGMPHTCLLLAA